jgi:hypothetical protein
MPVDPKELEDIIEQAKLPQKWAKALRAQNLRAQAARGQGSADRPDLGMAV